MNGPQSSECHGIGIVSTNNELQADHLADPVAGQWRFPNDNLMEFTEEGEVNLCGIRVGIWKREGERRYEVAYFRGYFDGASDALELSNDGQTIRGLANGYETRVLARVGTAEATDCIGGVWDCKNGNVVAFSSD